MFKFFTRSKPQPKAEIEGKPNVSIVGSRRNFAAANTNRLVEDWFQMPLSPDAAAYGKLQILRDRSRDLERNNPWVRGFLRTLENNVIGDSGIALQMRVKDDKSGKLDEVANNILEDAWSRWNRVGNCTVCGRHTWRDLQKLIIRSIARDGEVLIRKVVTKTGLKLQILEADLLDDHYNVILDNGNIVRFGVEMDQFRAPVAYYLLGQHPGDVGYNVPAPHRTRIDASQILHLYITDRPDQTRGLPWLVSSMLALKMLDGYSQAELVAARTGAAKMGFFTHATPEGWIGEEDGDGNLSMDASPGTIEDLPIGTEFQSWNNDHPNSGYGDFIKSIMRSIATSLGISYNSLASDLENVNFSSIRAGLLEEREVWKSLQTFLIEHACENIFTDWLSIELLQGRLGLPFNKLWKFDCPQFQGRRWGYVNPVQDMNANILAIRSGQKSLRQVIAETGGDVYDTMQSIKADNDLAASLGIVLPELLGPTLKSGDRVVTDISSEGA